ncbi:MAG TPA: secretion system protein Por, partial [Flavobacteriaceae bacterium]|nr:secretion system protein Por [Flavobacteriaceae bacterium]
GYYIRELGISYQFAANAVVDANQKMYLSSDPTIFENYYGFAPFGAFTRDLSNRSYNIILSDALGNTIDQVNYMDSDPWPEQADGEGPYLQLVDVNSDNSLASNWIASSQSLSIEDVATPQTQIIVYPNPTNGIVTIEYDFSITDALEFSIYNS